MRLVSSYVDDGRLVIVVESQDGLTMYDLGAAEIQIEAALNCRAGVITERMLPDRLPEVHRIHLVLRVDGEDVESLAFDTMQASVGLQRRDDGVVVGWFAVENDGLPPASLLAGGAGYPGAHTLVFRKVPVGDDRPWRLVKAVGWDQEGSDDELERLLAAAPRIDESTIRLLERLQTGWQPKRDEIDVRIPQRELARWEFAPSRHPSRPDMLLSGWPAGDDRSWPVFTDPVLWIDADLRWALCEDCFWWLEGS